MKVLPDVACEIRLFRNSTNFTKTSKSCMKCIHALIHDLPGYTCPDRTFCLETRSRSAMQGCVPPNRFICRGSYVSLVAMTSNSGVPQRLCQSCPQMMIKFEQIFTKTIKYMSNKARNVVPSESNKNNATRSRGEMAGYTGGWGIRV